jgi:phosphatidylinositol alpha-1,6-mannosyltransferase
LIGPRLKQEGLRYAVIVHASEMLVPAALPGVGARLGGALAQADVLFPVSDFTALQLERVLTQKGQAVPQLERLRARVDLDRFHPALGTKAIRDRFGIRPQERMVLCLGRLVRRKGVHRLIAIADDLARAVEDLVIVVAGTGPEEKRLRRAARDTNTRIVFTGRVSEADAPGLYAAADVFALPVVDRYLGLETEGLGVVLLEAASSGTPCVTGRSGGTPEAVIDGVTGFVIDARQDTELVSALARLLEDRSLAARMGRAGREHVAAEFSSSHPPDAMLRWLDS